MTPDQQTRGGGTTPRYCVFCNQARPLTNEHVWPRWLRGFPAYRALLNQTQGQKLPDAVFPEMTVNEAGQYTDRPAPRGRSPILPEVQVKVCGDCNNGWMAALELSVQTILTPWLSGTAHLVEGDEVRVLATWVAKTAMTYALWRPPALNPFSPEDYSTLMATRQPPEQTRVWVAFSDAPIAQVAMSLMPYWVGGEELNIEAMQHERPTLTSYYLAAHGIAFFMHFCRGDEGLAAVFDLPGQLRPGVQQIWPRRTALRGPLASIAQEQLEAMIGFVGAMIEYAGLPWDGHTPEEMREAHDRFQAGEEPAAIRGGFAARKSDPTE